MKKTNEPHTIKTSTEGLLLLANIRRNEAWTALLQLAESFLYKYEKDAFSLSEASPNFSRDHAIYKGKGLGIKEFLEFIDSATVKLEDRFIEEVKEDAKKKIIGS